MVKITASQIIELIERLPQADDHIFSQDGEWNITTEWLVGSFAGRSFVAKSKEAAALELIEYLYEHIGHKSIVGEFVTKSGFPNLSKVELYCSPKLAD